MSTHITERLKVGRMGAEIREIVHGSVTIDMPSINAGAVASASAAAGGLRTTMKVFVSGSNWQLPAALMGAQCLADDVITVWLGNNATGAVDSGSAVNIDYLAFRP